MDESIYSPSHGRSTFRRAAVLAALLAVPALADVPKFSSGGFLFSVDYGPGLWALDKAKLSTQVGADDADIFVADAQNTHTVNLHAGYDILGHVEVSADLTATGWNLGDANRGGAGFLVGAVAWHPLELVWMKKELRPVPLDVDTFFGVGYGISGQRRGMDGLVLQWGAHVQWFFTRYFGLGFVARGTFLEWNSFYLDYSNRSAPGATITLPNGSGGAFWQLGFSAIFRAGD